MRPPAPSRAPHCPQPSTPSCWGDARSSPGTEHATNAHPPLPCKFFPCPASISLPGAHRPRVHPARVQQDGGAWASTPCPHRWGLPAGPGTACMAALPERPFLSHFLRPRWDSPRSPPCFSPPTAHAAWLIRRRGAGAAPGDARAPCREHQKTHRCSGEASLLSPLPRPQPSDGVTNNPNCVQLGSKAWEPPSPAPANPLQQQGMPGKVQNQR